jgi:cytochrome c oxidase subunit 2
MIQEVVWGVSIVLMGTLAAVFAWVAIGANVTLADADSGPVFASAYRVSIWLFGLAIIVLVGANYDTLGKLPYVSSMSASSSAKAMQPVEAVAEQWSWSIKPAAFRVGETVEFHVTSTDVNHVLRSTIPTCASLLKPKRCPDTSPCCATPSMNLALIGCCASNIAASRITR